MFDFFSILNVNQKQPGPTARPAQDGAKKAAEGSAKPEGGQTTGEAAASAAKEAGAKPLPKSQLLGIVNSLRRNWQAIRQSGKFDAQLANQADETFAKLVNLDKFNMKDLEVLRRMSRATSALRASVNKEARGSVPQQPGAETSKPDHQQLQSQAKVALSKLRAHIERIDQARQNPAQATQQGGAGEGAARSGSTPSGASKASAGTTPQTSTTQQSAPAQPPVSRQVLTDGPKPPLRNPSAQQPESSVSKQAPSTQKPAKRETPSTPAAKGGPSWKPDAPERTSPQRMGRQGKVLGGPAGRAALSRSRPQPPTPRPPTASSQSVSSQGPQTSGGAGASRGSSANRPAPPPSTPPNATQAQDGPQLLRSRPRGKSFATPGAARSSGGFIPSKSPTPPKPAPLPGATTPKAPPASGAQGKPVSGQPLRGPATGSRPVTSHVPIYNPTLDSLHAFTPIGDSQKVEAISLDRASKGRQMQGAHAERMAHASQRQPLLGGMKKRVQDKRQGGGGGNKGQSGATGKGGESKAPQTQANQMRQSNLQALSKQEALRLSLQKLNAGPSAEQVRSSAVRHAGHSISSLLKKLYRDQEIEELDEDTAVNSLGLILKMGGEFTYAHSARVLDLAMELADEVGITDRSTRKQIKFGAMLKDIGEMGMLLDEESDEKLDKMSEFMSGQNMLRAGLLHDIGKIKIPKEILYKPGRLTEEEYDIIKMHPIYGEEIVYPITSLRHLCPTIRGHHERWDGKGYPDGLAGEDIPLPARIIAVADVFDALAAERPYKKGMEVARVRRILEEGRGSHFDPDLCDAFLRIIDRRYPELAQNRPE